jgi:hypothetical protein
VPRGFGAADPWVLAQQQRQLSPLNGSVSCAPLARYRSRQPDLLA